METKGVQIKAQTVLPKSPAGLNTNSVPVHPSPYKSPDAQMSPYIICKSYSRMFYRSLAIFTAFLEADSALVTGYKAAISGRSKGLLTPL
jgi:hypothetical protein